MEQTERDILQLHPIQKLKQQLDTLERADDAAFRVDPLNDLKR